jgi:hypothetical protein
MQLDNQTLLLTGGIVNFLFKIGIVTLAIFYFLFSLVVIRQVRIMTNTVITEAGPLLRAFSILHAGAALIIVIFFIAFI